MSHITGIFWILYLVSCSATLPSMAKTDLPEEAANVEPLPGENGLEVEPENDQTMSFEPPDPVESFARFTASGEVSVRPESVNNLDFDSDTPDRRDYLSLLARIGFGVDLDGGVHGCLDVQSNPLAGSAVGVGTEPEDYSREVRLYQGFLELTDIGGVPLDIRLGRQELGPLGREFLLGDEDFYAGSSFDGVRLQFRADPYTSEAWLAILGDVGAFIVDDHTFFGWYNTYRRWESLSLDLYLMGIVNEPVTVGLLEPARDTYATGLRLSGLVARVLDYSVEFCFQFGQQDGSVEATGSVAGLTRRAFGGEAVVGYTAVDTRFKPHVGIAYTYGSGDGDLDDDLDQTFHPFFQEGRQRFGYTALFNGSNLQTVTAEVSLDPIRSLQLGINALAAMVVEPTSSLAGVLSFQQVRSDAGTYLGFGGDVFLKYRHSDNLLLFLDFSGFLPGDYIEDQTGQAPEPFTRLLLHTELTF